MTVNSHKVTNPITDEDLVLQSVINETVDSARLDVLRALEELSSPITQTDIAQHADISRQAVSNHLAVLRDRGFINNRRTEIELTAGGFLMLDVIERSLCSISVEELSFLTRSEHSISILRELEKQQYRKNELAAAVNSSPSRPTIRRVLNSFEEYGWTQENGRQQQITPTGAQVLNCYAEMEQSIKQLIEKAPWLQRLSPEDAPYPVQELADAELIISDPSRPVSVLWTALKLYDRKISHFRALCSIYDPVLFHSYRGLLELGVESEAILDLSTYIDASENPQTRYVVKDSSYSNYQPLVLDREHTLGIGIYDNRKIAVAGYNEYGSGKHIVMIISSNEQLIEWGINLYESYRRQARLPSELDLNKT